ncbi:hypothetical protein SAMN02745225_02333 [Ferrithrix thermotolerans DSM 19514]|uniref:Uncharacterized protein n=2 Tax=Ferrithrix TaxID=643949 RepID=A0A1M4YGE9_9ACTN|nr:hypothetical protein SAMN02745225_02333 [Ferrithrix thermotolerans DSM 19514]
MLAIETLPSDPNLAMMPENTTARKPRDLSFDPFKEVVDELVLPLSAPAILERLIPLGYGGKETAARDLVGKDPSLSFSMRDCSQTL